MPALRPELIATIGGPGGAGPSTSDTIDVGITFWRCAGGSVPPPFTVPGGPITCFAVFQWSYNGTNVEVQDFDAGDIIIGVEEPPETDDLIRLGRAGRAGVALNQGLSGGSNGRFVLPMTLNGNSAATVIVTVINNAAYHINNQMEQVYGPRTPVQGRFGYSTLRGTLATVTTPEVDVFVPGDLPHTEATAEVALVWNTDMRTPNPDPTISGAADADIRIQVTEGMGNAVYVANSFETSLSGRRMTFDLNLTNSGRCLITVGENEFSDQEGHMGPAAPATNAFYFNTAYTHPTDDATGTNVVTIYDSTSRAHNYTSDTVLGSGGGGFLGFSDLELIDGNLYANSQIMNARLMSGGAPQNELNQAVESRGALFRIASTARNSSSPTVLKRYDRFRDSARSITEYGDSVYFFEGSHNRDGLGHVRSVLKTGTTITDHGVPWRSRRINPDAETVEDNLTYGTHVRTASRMIVNDENLYVHAGYNDPQYIKSEDWASSELPDGQDIESTRIDNWTLLRYGADFDFRLPVLQTNDQTGIDVIADMAALCFCYYGFDPDGTFIVRPRFQPKATLSGNIDISATPTTITYKDANMVVPSSGLVRILGQNGSYELFSYTGRTDNTTLTGVQRAQHGTTADDHCEDTSMLFINHVIDMDEPSVRVRPINELSIQQDTTQLFNIIKMRFGDPNLDKAITSTNSASVERNQPKELEIPIALTYHQSNWISWLADQYRDFYSNIRYLVTVDLKPSFYIKKGDFILLREPNISLINNLTYQVISVQHQYDPVQTRLRLRSIT